MTAFGEETRRGVPRRLCKFSAKVIEMKRAERALIRGRRFQEAIAVQERRIAEEKVERGLWKVRFAESRERAKRKLEREEELRVEWIQSSNALLRQRIAAEGHRCIEAIRKAKTNLENKVVDINCAIFHEDAVRSGGRLTR